MLEPTLTVPPVVREITVAAPIDTCFATFVDDMGSWWPPEHHIGIEEVVEMRVEPEVGGRCYDVGADGSECHWGTVLMIERPTRLVFAWHVQGDWTIDVDPDRQSQVDVAFTAIGPERTAVRLEHRGLDRHGDGAAGIREGVDSPGGWTATLARFRDVMEGRPPRPMLPPDA
jgi:uncharacterized protein YndB with AHSA1/START domain